MAHTPGPWVVRRESDYQNAIKADSGYGRTIAVIDNTDTEDMANTALIEASPELLEQLERMVNIATHPKATKEQIRMIANESRAAIDKAKDHRVVVPNKSNSIAAMLRRAGH